VGLLEPGVPAAAATFTPFTAGVTQENFHDHGFTSETMKTLNSGAVVSGPLAMDICIDTLQQPNPGIAFIPTACDSTDH